MRLKTIEIKGFKSFANQTAIHFSEDVIGIVGPNGSGKSNIVDAIRWVLGEQKGKELRLDKMSSVIFNGTKKRKASGMASVSLTLENTKNLLPTDYQTITITRILYNTGDSEYKLNNVTCRLKDITSLFMDTGIGSNSYAIISLGMVDELLQDKDQSRIKMFEQAAGISKYKVRKHQTMLKLKNTEEDLSRIDDLLFEIDGNLKSLEKQAKRTEKYYELKSSYKDKAIVLGAAKISTNKERFDNLKSKITKQEDGLITIETKEKTIEASLQRLRNDLVGREQALADKQQQANQLLSGIRTRENQKQILEEKLGFIKTEVNRADRSIKNNQQRIEELKKDIERYKQMITEAETVELQLATTLESSQSQLNTIRESQQGMEVGRESLIQTQRDIEQKIFELEKKKAVNNNYLENLQSELKKNEFDLSSKLQESKSTKSEFSDLVEAVDAKQALVSKLDGEETQRTQQLELLTSELNKQNEEKAKVARRLDAAQNEFQLTKSMVDSLEGFPESIKFLSNNKNWSAQAILLTDIIYCPEEYRAAIESYLEPFLNYYIVQTYDEALAGIALLKKSQHGKANFIVLEGLPKPGKAHKPPAGATPASSIVETDLIYQGLMHYLLDKVYIVEDADKTHEVHLEYPDLTFISESGSYMGQGGKLYGGSVGLFEGKKIGRKKNLEVLEKQITKTTAQVDKINQRIEQLNKEVATLKNQNFAQQLKAEANLLNQLVQKKISIETRLENYDQFIESTDKKKDEAQDFIDQVIKQNEQITTELAKVLAEKDTFKSEFDEKDSVFRDISEQASSASEAFNQANISHIKQQNKKESLSREMLFRESQLKELQHNLGQQKQTFEQNSQEISQIQEKIVLLQNDLLTDYEEKKSKEGLLNEVEQAWHDSRKEINTLETDLRTIYRQRQETLSLLSQLKDKFNESKIEINSVLERLEIEFNVSKKAVMAIELPEGYDLKSEQEQASRIRNRLDNYGEINPLAVEAYQEIKERHDNISIQRQDILDAKDNLLETIGEIETTATAQFMEAFEEVRKNFKEVFQNLFTAEDDCDLTLTVPEDPLNSNIEIMAKPKGKRPQSISQLSGGEKTLTAVALLFALYLLKPAPFCIFDEVDAPLDDANIEKFNRIIQRFSHDSQFIVVTHNKATMAAVDIIYGVYMQEQGVSAVTPVDFRNYEHDAVLAG